MSPVLAVLLVLLVLALVGAFGYAPARAWGPGLPGGLTAVIILLLVLWLMGVI